MNVIQAKYFYAPKTHEINWEKAEPWRTFFKKNNTLLRYVVVQSRTHFDSLRPHGLQHARLPCPSLSPQVCSNSCPLSWWCHPAISSSVTLFSCPRSFQVLGSFPMSRLFASVAQVLELQLQHQSFFAICQYSPNCRYLGNNPVSQFF